MRLRLAAIVVLAALSTAALAQLRTIPEDAKRGQMRHVHAMQVSLDGRDEELAPGAQIRDAHNRVVLPIMLASSTAVKYRRNGEGRVFQVWILTPDEAARDEAKK